MDIEADRIATPAPQRVDAVGGTSIYRHRLPVRVMHWINVACMTILLGSGLNIFNAHPTLYWGHDSVTGTPWLSIRGENTPNGPVGKTRLPLWLEGAAKFRGSGQITGAPTPLLRFVV